MKEKQEELVALLDTRDTTKTEKQEELVAHIRDTIKAEKGTVNQVNLFKLSVSAAAAFFCIWIFCLLPILVQFPLDRPC